jgi:hypothetical protein
LVHAAFGGVDILAALRAARMEAAGIEPAKGSSETGRSVNRPGVNYFTHYCSSSVPYCWWYW